MTTISKRSEILFLYETENANPNGDPLNENRPRFDTEENKVLVSDVRLKRTIRDYWFEYKGYNGSDEKDIYARETRYEENGKTYVRSGKERAAIFKENKDKVLDTCIDVRVFGGILPIKGNTYTYTGPVQFQMGKSLHETTIETEEGTSPFASSEGDKKKGQTTFRTEYKVPYALIGFNGIVNEKAAQYTQMTEEDKDLLIEGIWNGTKNLISRSKFGQTPLLLLVINYKEPFYIGGLRQRLKLKSDKNDLQVRGTEDYKLDISEVRAALKENADKIENIYVQIDPRLKIMDGETSVSLKNGVVNEL
jgi:CRISPR-associated protein Csh2